MQTATQANTRRCLLRAAAVLLFGWLDGLVCTAGFGATTILDPAQVAQQFIQRSWQKKDGLPDNTVQALLQTRDGYLWIGTSRGLVRFDGLKFAAFDHVNSPEMVNDNCRSLAEDTVGNVWIATGDGLLRTRNGHFRRFTRSDGLSFPPGDATDGISFVFADRGGGVWVKSDVLTLFQNGTFKRFDEQQLVATHWIHGLHEDASDTLWATGSGYLCRRLKRTERFEVEEVFHLGKIHSMQDDGAGGLWFLCNPTATEGWLYHHKDGQWSKRSDRLAFAPRSIFLSLDHRGGLWIAAADKVLSRFFADQFTRYRLPPELGHDFVLCLIEDREGNLWFGTESSGLHCWKPKAISSYDARDGLANDSTWTICEARDGSVWIGTEHGVSQLKDGRFRNFTKLDGLSGDQVRSVAEDAAGEIWVGTGSGLSVIRDGIVRPQLFPHQPELNKVRVVCAAKEGAVWVGTVAGLFHLESGQWTTFTPTNGLAKAGLYGDVLALREDKSGTLWIGTAGGGLQSFRDGKFSTWTTTNGLSNNFVWALHEDTEGVLWIGTESGLNRYENDRFTVFTKRDGLPADLVNEILEDDLGNLWVSHDHGVYRVRKLELNEVAAGRSKQVQAVSYDEADGMPSNETNGQKSYPAGCKTRDGRLWFPTPNGVAVIDPKLCDLDTVAPHAALEQVRADGEIIFDSAGVAATPPSPAGSGAILDHRATKASLSPRGDGASRPRMRLPPGSGRVMEFRYTAPVFTAPEKAAFRYRLRGADDRWIEAGTRREAYFTRLHPGAYDFEVMAASHRGVWGEKGAIFSFYIEPFYYQTWWFYGGCGLTTIGLLVGLVAWRIRGLRKMHRLEQQSAITEERTRIAKDLHDGLGADLTRLSLLADLVGDEGSAGVDGPRQKLSRSSREAARTLKEMIWIANPANDTLEGLVSRICQTAEDFLGDARVRCRLDLAPQLPQRALSLDQRRNLLLATREALNNIIKHAAATEVCIRANGSDNTFHLAIEDNGRGFDPAAAGPGGLGLASMRRRVENSGGRFGLVAHQGVGTKILITLKLGQAGDDSTGN